MNSVAILSGWEICRRGFEWISNSLVLHMNNMKCLLEIQLEFSVQESRAQRAGSRLKKQSWNRGSIDGIQIDKTGWDYLRGYGSGQMGEDSEGTVGCDSHADTIGWVAKNMNSWLGCLHANQSFCMNWYLTSNICKSENFTVFYRTVEKVGTEAAQKALSM